MKELEKRINAIDIANGGNGNISIEIAKEVSLKGATMYVANWSSISTSGTSAFIVYEDGTLFHQDDWQGGHPETAEEITDFEWLTEDSKLAVMSDGLPRIFG